METVTRADLEAERLRDWELLMLLKLDFTEEQAELLVVIPNFTWHDARRLLDKGASHDFVVDQLT